MKVFLSFLILSALTGIFLRDRPFYQSQLVVMALAVIVAGCYFFLGML